VLQELSPQEARIGAIAVSPRSDRLAEYIDQFRWKSARGDRGNLLAVVGHQRAKCGAAQRHRLVEHRVEHRREIAGRRVDDLQHLGGRGLLLQRLARFVDEPRVLDRDHRLRGEVL